MADGILTLRLLKDRYGVCRLDKSEKIPEWAINEEFFSITKTKDELSIVCPLPSIPEDIPCEKDWRIFKIEGPLDFSLIGILAPICTILAERKISIFAISTYDTDYILAKDKNVDQAVLTLKEAKYHIITE